MMKGAPYPPAFQPRRSGRPHGGSLFLSLLGLVLTGLSAPLSRCPLLLASHRSVPHLLKSPAILSLPKNEPASWGAILARPDPTLAATAYCTRYVETMRPLPHQPPLLYPAPLVIARPQSYAAKRENQFLLRREPASRLRLAR